MSEPGVERTVRVRNGKVPTSVLPPLPGVDATGEPDGQILTTRDGEPVWAPAGSSTELGDVQILIDALKGESA